MSGARHSFRRRLAVLGVAFIVAAAAGVGIWAFFTGGAVAGSFGRSQAGALPAPAAPTATLTGRDVGLSWGQTTVQGAPLGTLAGGGYVVRRYALDDLATPIATSAGCAGTRTGPGDPLGCTENAVATGRWRYSISSALHAWRTGGPTSATVTIAPLEPLSVALANGGGVADAYINSGNDSSLDVDVVLPATSLASDSVELTLSDPGDAHTVTTSASATSGGGTVHFTGNDVSVLNDGTITISAVASSSYGDDSSAATAASVKDTLAPSNSLSLTGNSPAGSAFRSGSTIFYRGTGGGAGGALRIRNAVSDGRSGPYSSTTAALGGTSTGWSHTPGTVATPSGGPFDSNTFDWSEETSSSPTEVVTGADAAGNTSAAPELTLTDDSVAPTTGATLAPAPNGASWSRADVTVALAASDSGSGVREISYAASGAQTIGSTTVAGSATSPVISAEGTTTVSFAATDNVGNGEATKTQVVKLDKTDPATTDDTVSIGNGWKNTNQTVTLSPSDATSGVAHTFFTTDGSTPTASSSEGTSISLTSDGVYTIKYFSVDVAGNTETVRTAGTQIRIDKTAPDTATLDNLPAFIKNGHTLKGSGHDALSGVDSLAYYRCSGTSCTPSTLIGSSTAGPDYPVSWTSQPADGPYQVLARVTDNAGNSTDSVKQTVRIDNTPPSTTDNADAAWHGSAVTVTLTASDGSGSGVASTTYSVDGGAAQSGTSVLISAPANHSNDGIHTISYFSTDGLGNVESGHAATVKIDTTVPQTTATGHDSSWHTSAVTVHLSAADPGFGANPQTGSGVDTLKHRIDGGTQQTINGSGGTAGGDVVISAPANGSNDGIHAITYFGTDNAGNVESTGSASVKIDVTPPATTDNTASIGNGWKNTNQTVTLSPSDATSGVAHTYYTTDGSTPTASSSEGTAISLTSDGVYTIKYFSVDVAGNSETVKTAGTQIRIDKTNPSVSASVIANTINNTPGYVKKTGSYIVYANVSDATSGVSTVTANLSSLANGSSVALSVCASACTVGGVTYGYKSATQTANASTDGSKSYTVTATDAASNSASPSFSVLVDTVNPTVPSMVIADITNNTAAFVKAGQGYFVYANASDASAGINGVTANVANITTGATSVNMTFCSLCYLIASTQYSYRSGQQTANSGLSDGATQNSTITATDNAGNSFTTSTFATKVDNAAPTTTAASDSTWHNSAFTFSLTPSDGTGSGVASTTWSIDTGESGTGTTVSVPAPADHSRDGTRTITFRSTDNVGNVESNKTTTRKIDTTNPTGAFTTPANGTSYTSATWPGNPSFSGTASDAASGITATPTMVLSRTFDSKCINGGGNNWVSCPNGPSLSGTTSWSKNVTFANLTSGMSTGQSSSFTATLTVTDAAGNQATVAITFSATK